MNDYLAFVGELEIRQEGSTPVLTASFPLGVTATRSNRGRVRKERFASGSMSWQVREFAKLQTRMAQVIESSIEEGRKRAMIEELEDALESRNTHLLVGHSFDKAIADMKSGTLAVEHTPDRVYLRANLPPVEEQPSHVRDAVLSVKGGQLRGVSPGFDVTAQGSERLVPEANGPSMVREILDSTVYEYSLVARPTYPLTDIDTRSEKWAYIPRRKRFWL